MTITVNDAVVVEAPVEVVYHQWTQFEEFPRFMTGVLSVRYLTDARLLWVAEIAGIHRQWETEILDQEPERRIAWAATQETVNSGVVTLKAAGDDRTEVHLELEYVPGEEPEAIGDHFDVVQNRAEKTLEQFKDLMETDEESTDGWLGAIDGEPTG